MTLKSSARKGSGGEGRVSDQQRAPCPPLRNTAAVSRGWRWQCELLGSPRPRGKSLWQGKVMLPQPHINTELWQGAGRGFWHQGAWDAAGCSPRASPPGPNHHPALLTLFPSLPSSLVADALREEVSDGLPGGRHPVPHQTLRGLAPAIASSSSAPAMRPPSSSPAGQQEPPLLLFQTPGGLSFPPRVTPPACRQCQAWPRVTQGRGGPSGGSLSDAAWGDTVGTGR